MIPRSAQDDSIGVFGAAATVEAPTQIDDAPVTERCALASEIIATLIATAKKLRK